MTGDQRAFSATVTGAGRLDKESQARLHEQQVVARKAARHSGGACSEGRRGR